MCLSKNLIQSFKYLTDDCICKAIQTLIKYHDRVEIISMIQTLNRLYIQQNLSLVFFRCKTQNIFTLAISLWHVYNFPKHIPTLSVTNFIFIRSSVVVFISNVEMILKNMTLCLYNRRIWQTLYSSLWGRESLEQR